MNPKYMFDSYLKEFDTMIKSVKDDKFIVLNDTIFYPNGGGQPNDTGLLRIENGEEYKVIFVGKFSGEISHEVEKPGLKVGDKVKCIIDWDRRYAHMRYHTASHVLSAILHEKAGAQITGNQITEEKLRIDFNMDNFDRELLQEYVDEANLELKKNHEVTITFMEREEALKLPGMVKLAGALPPNVKELRIVTIGTVDRQADGGTHVKNTSECGSLEIIKAENKGKNNRRLYVKMV